jgi:hypothetical protein
MTEDEPPQLTNLITYSSYERINYFRGALDLEGTLQPELDFLSQRSA